MKNKKPAIAYLHTHWDPEWYKTADMFNIRLVEIGDKILSDLKGKSTPFFYFDGQVLALLNYLKFRPQKKALVKKLIKEKKLFIGPFFASVDSFLVSGAFLIKNLALGIKISKEFGENSFIGYLSDTFGHSKSIFEILEFFNIKNAVIWRGTPSFPADFKANGINVTRLVYGYYQDVLHSSFSLDKKAEILEKTLDKINEKSLGALLLPIGADHMAPLNMPVETINEMNSRLSRYEIKLKTPFEYFKLADYSKFEYNGEFLNNAETFILPGVYSARIPEKIENAKLQWELSNKIEPFDYFTGQKYKSELNFATVELIKNHAHDSIYGCSTDGVHQKVRARQLAVKETLNGVEKNLIRDFKKKYLISENPQMVGVFNFSNSEKPGVVKIVTDKKLKNAQKIRSFKTVDDDILTNIYKNPMTEDFHTFFEYFVQTPAIPAFSFKNAEILKPVPLQTVGEDFIENENLKLFVLDGKIFVTDKKTGKLYSDFICLLSTKDGGDSYNFAPEEHPKRLDFVSSKIKVKGKIKSTLELRFEENIKINVSLYNGADFFEFKANFVNKKKNRKLQVSINTGEPVKETIAENPLGEIKRSHDPDYLLYNFLPAPSKKELKTNSYPMQRYVRTNGVTAVTVGLNEYEVYKNELKITLLRSVGIISNPKNKARSIPAGPPIECPDMQCLGSVSMDFAITFGDNPTDVAEILYNPYVSILGEFKIKNKLFLRPKKGEQFLGITEINGVKKPVFRGEKLSQ